MNESSSTDSSVSETPEENTPEITEDTGSKTMELETKDTWDEQKSIWKQALPLILLFVIGVLVHNILQIMIFVAFTLTFDAANDFIVKQTELGRKVSIPKVFMMIPYLIGCMCLTYPILHQHWLMTLFNRTPWPRSGHQFWDLLLMIAVSDFLLKYLTILLKSLVLISSGKIVSYENQGRIYMAIEGLSQIFRCLFPVPEWAKYILKSSSCFSKVICGLFAALYFFLKFKALMKKIPIFLNALKFRTITGCELQSANHEDIATTDGVRLCSICHDSFINPVKLPCQHIFCSACIHQWFNRDKHCPKCNSDAINSMVLGFPSLSQLVVYTGSNNKWKTGLTDYVVQFF